MFSFRSRVRSVLQRSLFAGALAALLLVSHNAYADGGIDTVLLKSGGRVRGTIMVDDPKTGVSIRLLDGTTRDVKRADIREVDYAPPQSAAPPPAPVPAPAPPPSAPSHGLPPVALGAPPSSDAGAAPADPAPPLRPTRHRHREYDEGSGNEDVDSDGQSAPSGSHYESRSLKGLWVAGLVLDLSAWAIRAAITAAVCEADGPCSGRQVAGAAVPVVGAWVQLSAGIGDGDGQNKPAGVAAEVGFGVVETAGFIMFVTGLAVHKKRLVHDTVVDVGQVHIEPLLSGRTMGISGSF